MIAAALLAFLPVLPQGVHDYQPLILDPGLDGGLDATFIWGELTPDGRLLIAFRRLHDVAHPENFMCALTASVTNPELMQKDSKGHLKAFYTPDDTFNPDPLIKAYGGDFTFGSYNPAAPDWAKIHWGYELIPCTGGACIGPCTGLPNPVKLDPDFPIPLEPGWAQMTLAMQPLATANPYPSDANGVYDVTGGHTTYKIWLVRTHASGFTQHVCGGVPSSLVKPLPSLTDPVSVFAAQKITVVVLDGTSHVVKTDVVKPYDLITSTGGSSVRGLEPSITADGRLILYHGNGEGPGFAQGNAVVTYIFNPEPCEATGWSHPHPITTLPDAGELGSMTLDQFKQRYRLFAHLPRMPRNGIGSGGDPFLPHQNVNGTYPWVSKDGSFYNAYSVRSTDTDLFPSTKGLIKSAAYACGDVTGWTIKHIDDTALNPTRHGGKWAWPWYHKFTDAAGAPNFFSSWGSATMSTGIKPGLWEPLLGEGAPLPTMEASGRIPVLPLFLPVIDSYGEVRFEEADGNYLLYMACNESLALDPEPFQPLEDSGYPWLIDAHSTPDSAARSDATGNPLQTALCSLNAGAAFPQEVYLSSGMGGGVYSEASKALREAIGAAFLTKPAVGPKPFHENVGFKGQGIVLSTAGAISVAGTPPLKSLTAFTVQMFVKSVGGAFNGPLFEYGQNNQFVFKLSVTQAGVFQGRLSVKVGATTPVLTVQSPSAALVLNQPLTNQTLGWRHVAVTYVSDPAANQTYLRLFVDGELVDDDLLSSTSSVNDLGTSPYYYLVGPGRSANPGAVTLTTKSLVIDEVALSRVQRTEAEIRRDAFVAPVASGFGPWPGTAPGLPTGLDPAEAKWPTGTAYDYNPAIVTLGQQLFASPTLSASATDPLVSGSRSCSTCHLLSKSFSGSPAQFPTSIIDGITPIALFNTPTLINAAFGAHKMFSGKASSLEDQIRFPLTSGLEMGVQTMQNVVDRVNADPNLDFQVFGGTATEDNLGIALAMYLRLQKSGAAPFDLGLTPGTAAYRGKELFFGKARCFSCHRGSNFSDDEFHNIRTVSASSQVDTHGDVTGRPNEIGQLKTPTLRNLRKTHPFFHDGSLATLGAVILHYNDPFGATAGAQGVEDRDLRPLDLTSPEMADLEAFLLTLTP